MPGKIHPLQGNPQAPRQLQGDQGQRQRLSAAALDDLVQQGDLRARRAVVFAKIQLAQAPQQRLRQFLRRQGGQAEADLLLQRGEFTQHLGRLQRRIVFGGNPQRRFEDRGRLPLKAGKTGLAWAHGYLRTSFGCSRLGGRRPVLRLDILFMQLGFAHGRTYAGLAGRFRGLHLYWL
ncbi:hypothetical protein D9M68_707690 [compost metagenome]